MLIISHLGALEITFHLQMRVSISKEHFMLHSIHSMFTLVNMYPDPYEPLRMLGWASGSARREMVN